MPGEVLMAERKFCPDCGGDLGKSATKCRCGWVASIYTSTSAGHRQCAHDPKCQYPGRMKVDGKPGLVCVTCYDAALRPVPLREPGEEG
jgi:hypothetical protein